MTRVNTFTFRINETERQMLAVLADRLQRSQSDAVRYLIRQAVEDLVVKSNPQRIEEIIAETIQAQ